VRSIEHIALGAGGKPLAMSSLARRSHFAALLKVDFLLQNSRVLQRALARSPLVASGF
jgi:hypothetical protein